jgi:hypothetical protein
MVLTCTKDTRVECIPDTNPIPNSIPNPNRKPNPNPNSNPNSNHIYNPHLSRVEKYTCQGLVDR